MRLPAFNRFLSRRLALPLALPTLLSLVLGAQAARADLALRAGDRVVFYGDSITEQRMYTTLVETYLVTRFPRLPLSFVHSGWGGDRVSGGGGGPIDLRLQRDVVAYKPTVMTIMLGMNDGSYRAFDQGTFDTYSKGLSHIVDTMQKELPGVRLTLIQPSPYDDVTQDPKFEGGYNAVLVRYGQFLQELARQNKQSVADLNAPVVAMLGKAKASDAALAQKIIPDRVHPGLGGHIVMAQALLQAWGAPSLVTDVEIDAAARRAVRAQNTQVSAITGQANPAEPILAWTQADAALPMPLDTGDPAVALAVKSSDVVEALDREPLRVTGLPPARYTLKIDGTEAGDFSSEQLAQGLNLATLPTPMQAQAAQVHRLTLKHNNQHSFRWREVQVPLQAHSEAVQKSLPPLLDALDAEEAETVAQQRAAAQPQPRRYELSLAQPAPAGPNLALRKTYVSSDPNVFNFGYGGLTDGSWEASSQHAFATGDKDAFPKSATIDLGEAKPVAQVRLGVPGFGSTKTVQVSLSVDGQAFTPVGSYTFSLRREEKHLFSFAPLNARYVRLSYPDHHAEDAGYTPTFAFTSEVEVYGPAA